MATAVLALAVLPAVPLEWMRAAVVLAAVASSILGLAVCPLAARHFADPDPRQVVIDEVAGVCCALALVPAPLLHDQLLVVVLVAVACFRVFDIAKPWPVGWLERIPGPTSIMLDDMAAGLLAGLVTTALLS
jgi:phosphatidylglycerophosphatase A